MIIIVYAINNPINIFPVYNFIVSYLKELVSCGSFPKWLFAKGYIKSQLLWRLSFVVKTPMNKHVLKKIELKAKLF